MWLDFNPNILSFYNLWVFQQGGKNTRTKLKWIAQRERNKKAINLFVESRLNSLRKSLSWDKILSEEHFDKCETWSVYVICKCYGTSLCSSLGSKITELIDVNIAYNAFIACNTLGKLVCVLFIKEGIKCQHKRISSSCFIFILSLSSGNRKCLKNLFLFLIRYFAEYLVL